MADYQKIVKTYENALGSVTQSTYSWTAFLRSACRNYKFGFDEQLLIYAQRPDATAVLMFDKWNKDFGRRIRSGAKGIAVFDTQAGRGRLKHYFDVSDTYPTSAAKEVPIWKLTPQNARAVVERLQRVYELDGNGGADDKAPAADLAQTLIAAAKSAVEDSFERHFDDMAELTLTGNLSDLDEDSLSAVYRNVLENSVAYMLLTRCGLDASRFIDNREFQHLSNFSSRHAVGTLGGAVSELGENCLREIAAAAQNREKAEKKKSEKSAQISNRTFDNAAAKNYIDIGAKYENERGLQNGYSNGQGNGQRTEVGGVSAAGQTARPHEVNRGNQSVDNVPRGERRNVTGLQLGGRERGTDRGASGGAGGTGLREVRDNAETLLGEAQAGAFLDTQNDADASRALGRGSERSDGQNGTANQADGQSRGSDRGTQSPRPNGVGGRDEQYPGAGGGNYVAGSGLRVNQPPPQDEQLDILERAGSSFPAFSISQQIIDEVLTSGGNSEHSPHRIVSIMKKDDEPIMGGVLLSEEYGEGGKGFIIDSQRVSAWFNADGIRIAVGDNARTNPAATLVEWEQAARRTRELLDLGRFMPQAELDKVDGYELAEVAERILLLNHELNEDAKLDFLESFGVNTQNTNFPNDTARIAEMLASRDGLDKIVKGFDDWIVKYFEDESIVRFKTKTNDPVEVMGAVYRLIDEPLYFESHPDFERLTSQFITQDEIDAVLIERGSGTEGNAKYRICSYFLQDHSANEKAAFLREEYRIS